jgi:iron complex outermembrane receptor protein
VEGEYLPLVPPLRILSSISQILKMKSSVVDVVNLKAEADYNAAQNRYLALNNTETATPGYVLFNISANTELNFFKNVPLQFQFQVNNLLDKAYQSNLSRLKYFEYYTQSPNGRFGIYNMGRNFCLKLITSF